MLTERKQSLMPPGRKQSLLAHPSAWHAHNVHVAQLRYMLRHGMPQVIEEVLRRRMALALDVETDCSVATTEPYSDPSSSCASPKVRGVCSAGRGAVDAFQHLLTIGENPRT